MITDLKNGRLRTGNGGEGLLGAGVEAGDGVIVEVERVAGLLAVEARDSADDAELALGEPLVADLAELFGDLVELRVLGGVGVVADDDDRLDLVTVLGQLHQATRGGRHDHGLGGIASRSGRFEHRMDGDGAAERIEFDGSSHHLVEPLGDHSGVLWGPRVPSSGHSSGGSWLLEPAAGFPSLDDFWTEHKITSVPVPRSGEKGRVGRNRWRGAENRARGRSGGGWGRRIGYCACGRPLPRPRTLRTGFKTPAPAKPRRRVSRALPMYFDYLNVLVFSAVGLVFVFANLLVASVLRPKRKTDGRTRNVRVRRGDDR